MQLKFTTIGNTGNVKQEIYRKEDSLPFNAAVEFFNLTDSRLIFLPGAGRFH